MKDLATEREANKRSAVVMTKYRTTNKTGNGPLRRSSQMNGSRLSRQARGGHHTEGVKGIYAGRDSAAKGPVDNYTFNHLVPGLNMISPTCPEKITMNERRYLKVTNVKQKYATS